MFEPWNKSRAIEIINRYESAEAQTLEVLRGIQDIFGWVPDEAIPLVAHALNLSRADVHGVVTFYHDFRRAPPPRHILKLCRAEACQAMGADRLAAHAQAKLGVTWHQTGADGKFSLEAVFCLGLCATAPSAMLDNRLIGRLDAAKLDRLIEETP